MVDEEKRSVAVTKPEKKKQIDIQDFGTDANQTHSFVFDEVFGARSDDTLNLYCVIDANKYTAVLPKVPFS